MGSKTIFIIISQRCIPKVPFKLSIVLAPIYIEGIILFFFHRHLCRHRSFRPFICRKRQLLTVFSRSQARFWFDLISGAVALFQNRLHISIHIETFTAWDFHCQIGVSCIREFNLLAGDIRIAYRIASKIEFLVGNFQFINTLFYFRGNLNFHLGSRVFILNCQPLHLS